MSNKTRYDVLVICKANASHLDENVAALWVWLNWSKWDDLRTNAFSTSAKCRSHGKIFFICWSSLSRRYKKWRCVFYPYFQVKSLHF